MFERNPRSPMEMVSETNESLLPRAEIRLQGWHDFAEAHGDNYAKEKAKGVKSFQFATGDRVIQKVIINGGRKGGKMGPLWNDPRITDMDSHQCVALQCCKSENTLKNPCSL